MLGTRRETKVSKSFAASVSGITAALDSLDTQLKSRLQMTQRGRGGDAGEGGDSGTEEDEECGSVRGVEHG